MAFNFGGSSTPAPAPAPATSGGFSFGGASKAPAPAPAAAGGFSFGSTSSSTPAPAGGGFGGSSFGATTSTIGQDASKKDGGSSTGFSFGGSSAATPAPASAVSKDVKASAAAPVPAAGGFSFGGAAAPVPAAADASKAPAPAAASTTGGFSFGGAAASTATATQALGKRPESATIPTKTDDASKNLAPTTTITATTPTAGGFSFGGTPAATEKAKSQTAATATTTPAAVYNIPEPSQDYKTKTLEDIINSFTVQLEKDALAFTSEARRVSEWDAVLRDSQVSISDLADYVSRILTQQKDLDRTLSSVTAYQGDLNGTLDRLERHIDELFASSAHLMPEDADVQREKAYKRTSDVDSALTTMATQLESTVNDLNAAHERAIDVSSSNSLSQIVQIFNEHHETLAWLENTSKKIESEMETIGRGLQQAGI